MFLQTDMPDAREGGGQAQGKEQDDRLGKKYRNWFI